MGDDNAAAIKAELDKFAEQLKNQAGHLAELHRVLATLQRRVKTLKGGQRAMEV